MARGDVVISPNARRTVRTFTKPSVSGLAASLKHSVGLHERRIARYTPLPVKLRSVRDVGPGWDPRFFEKDARFWPVVRAAQTFEAEREWPAPESYGRAFLLEEPPVRFVTQKPRVRTRRGVKQPLDRSELYDAQIARGVVPTRARHWHDFMNALVWTTFPDAKRALHRRQHRLIEAWLPEGAMDLPNARTRPQDALALVDEGGIVLLRDGSGELAVPFGHALFEGIVFGVPSMVARGVPLDVARLPTDAAEAIALADRHLAARIDELVEPRALPRHPFRA